MTTIAEKYPSLANVNVERDSFSHDGREERLLQYILNHPDLEQMKGNPSKILTAIDDYANREEFLMNIGSDKAVTVKKIIAEEKPKVFMEIGGYVGYSAICFGEAMKQATADSTDKTPLQYWSLEMEASFCEISELLVDLAGLSDFVKFVSGPASDSIRRLHGDGTLSSIDMLFLDHVEDLYVAELTTCEDLGMLKTRSLVIADNVLTPGAPEYRRRVREYNKRYQTKAIPGLIVPGDFKDEIDVTRIL